MSLRCMTKPVLFVPFVTDAGMWCGLGRLNLPPGSGFWGPYQTGTAGRSPPLVQVPTGACRRIRVKCSSFLLTLPPAEIFTVKEARARIQRGYSEDSRLRKGPSHFLLKMLEASSQTGGSRLVDWAAAPYRSVQSLASCLLLASQQEVAGENLRHTQQGYDSGGEAGAGLGSPDCEGPCSVGRTPWGGQPWSWQQGAGSRTSGSLQAGRTQCWAGTSLQGGQGSTKIQPLRCRRKKQCLG